MGTLVDLVYSMFEEDSRAKATSSFDVAQQSTLQLGADRKASGQGKVVQDSRRVQLTPGTN